MTLRTAPARFSLSRPAPVRASRLTIVAKLTLLLAAGCRPPPRPEPAVLSDRVERGPYVLEVQVAPAEMWVGDAFQIRMRLATPPDTLVQFPDPASFGELTVKAEGEAAPRPTPNGLEWEQVYRGEVFASGPFEIPPRTVKYAEATADGSMPNFEHELSSNAIHAQVRSALTSQDAVTRPREITGTLAPPPRRLSPLEWGALAAVAVALGFAAWALTSWLRRRAKRPPPPVPAEVWALRELMALGREEWFTSARHREFYYRLTEIVRVYIERKFGLAAPEMTTEEFLIRLSRDRQALPYEPPRLREFLRACDLVKYAALEPRREDGEQALMTARAFVDATAAAAQRAAEAPATQREGQAA